MNTIPEIPVPLEPLTITIPETQRITGLGRNSILEEIEDGELEFVKVRNRRLVVYSSIKRLIAKRAMVPYRDTKRPPPIVKRGRAKRTPQEHEAATAIAPPV